MSTAYTAFTLSKDTLEEINDKVIVNTSNKKAYVINFDSWPATYNISMPNATIHGSSFAGVNITLDKGNFMYSSQVLQINGNSFSFHLRPYYFRTYDRLGWVYWINYLWFGTLWETDSVYFRLIDLFDDDNSFAPTGNYYRDVSYINPTHGPFSVIP